MKLSIDFTKNSGLVPAIIQDYKTGDVFMLGYMNKEALDETVKTGWVYFWSRSRKKLWMKGEESGNKLKVKNIYSDCDNDSILVKVELIGSNVCHTGNESCFYTKLGEKNMTLEELYKIIEDRKKNMPEDSYTASLFKEGTDRIVQKIGEEATEVVIAAKNEGKERLIAEMADLWFHSLVLLVASNVTIDEVMEQLEKRNKKDKTT